MAYKQHYDGDDNMYNQVEMVQRIATNKRVLWYLKLYYIDEIWEDSFQEELVERQFMYGVSEDEAYAMYFAARIPGEEHFERIMEKIEEIEADA